MKKVLFFIRSLNTGGSERQLVVTSKGLAERGYEVVVLTFYSGGNFADELSNTKVRLLSLNKKGRWDIISFFYRLISILKNEIPDVLYSYLGVANIFSVLIRPFVPRTQVVWGVRTSNMDLERYDWAARWSYWLECRLARFADCIVANSFAGRKFALEHGFPESKMVVIANGIDTKDFCPDETARNRLRKIWGIDENEKLIGLIARIDPIKGHPTFLEAAKLIRLKSSNIRFVCVGKGEAEYENSMRRLATEMGLNDVLIWVGECSNMVEVYNALDIASSSSYGEGFPNMIGEAMSCGVPCQVTDVGDSSLILDQMEFVVPPNDSEALCSAWRNILLLDHKDLQSKVISARERMISQFSILRLLRSTEMTLFKEVGCVESATTSGDKENHYGR
jgi:glycosyltransferase involved in cell wall biosynthesis